MSLAAAPSGLDANNLSPSLSELLALRFDAWVWLPLILVGGWYFVAFARSRKTSPNAWPIWRAVLFGLALICTVIVTQSQAITLTLNSMALYMGRLMVLAELVPPLAVLGMPRHLKISRESALGRVLSVILDPWVVLALWVAILIFWNIPAGFNASIVTNTAGALLPGLYLLGGLLVWSVILRPLPSIQGRSLGNRGWFGLLSGLPMMAVAAVWLYSPKVLYTPYVSALCLWNLTPLQNQSISGWIMMLAGLPGMAVALVQLMGWLIELADSGTQTPPPPTA
ncbi:cytochrome c oxidase assembly protein [Deinococcus psychrotolerans]|uniref:Cytochrome c oxidase assembly protein n=1 Tax=Deinococcus psychrotolerans TaxID=2489213 RepID=A0A3G8Y894_9DEIO|nr:cytochrome c oxidase assembly protein [Deinococcus psychrotolerans]AZI41588.1 cytochrome c oxidase assembly protein [Deinococcus psychrotolerans]